MTTRFTRRAVTGRVTLLALAGALATLAAVASCGPDLPFAPGTKMVPSADTASGLGTVADLTSHKQAWLAQGVRSYRFRRAESCFCVASDDIRPAVVEVREGQVTKVWNLQTGAAMRASAAITIEAYFDRAIAEASRSGGRVLVAYDRALGYPVQLTLGHPEVDAGEYVTITDLQRS